MWDQVEANLKVLIMSHTEAEATPVYLDKAGKMALYFLKTREKTFTSYVLLLEGILLF